MKGYIKKGMCLALTINLFGCYSQPPKPLPVLEFNQWPKTAVNPASYHACGNAVFPCQYRQVTIIKTETKSGIIKKVCK